MVHKDSSKSSLIPTRAVFPLTRTDRCDAEDLPTTPECKVEESIYHVPDTSGWSSRIVYPMPVDDAFIGSPSHSLSHCHSLSHNNIYGRSNTSDRWASSGADNLLPSLPMRQEHIPWTPALHSSHPSIARRRDTSHLSPTESWSSLNGSTGRWFGSHDVSNHTSPYLEQRARIRTSGHPYEEAASIRRDSESISSSYSHRFPGHCGRDTSHRGLSWHQRDVENLKDSRNHHADTSFTPSPTLPFSSYHQSHQHQHHSSNHSYSSSSGWSSTDTSVMDTPAALQALPPQTTISYDTTPYATNSTNMPGSAEFTNVDEMWCQSCHVKSNILGLSCSYCLFFFGVTHICCP